VSIALRSRSFGFVFAAALALAVSVPSGPARAADPEYELTLYVWGAMLAGKVDTDQGEATARMSFSDVWDNLNLALMARGRAQWDKVSLVGDFEYFDLESDREQRTVRVGPSGNIEIPASVKVEVVEYVAELSAGYEILNVKGPFSRGPGDERGTVAELYAGGRYFSVQPDITVKFGGARRDLGKNHSWVDAIVGTRIGIDLSRSVVLGIQGDVGGFNIGNSSEFSWSQITSLSWNASETLTLSLGYKFLEFKKDKGDDYLKLQMRGPFVASAFRF